MMAQPAAYLSQTNPVLNVFCKWIQTYPSFCCAIRNSQYYEKVSDPLDLSTIEKQILTGHYKTVEAFDTDMLKVFRNAEVGRCTDIMIPFNVFRLHSYSMCIVSSVEQYMGEVLSI